MRPLPGTAHARRRPPPLKVTDRTPLSPHEHRAYIEERFRRCGAVQAEEAWERGLVTMHAPDFTTGSQSAQRSVHRASCPLVALIATVPDTECPAPIWPVTTAVDVCEQHDRCSTCGTLGLPDRTVYWGDSAEDITSRVTQARLASQVRQYRAARAVASAEARRLAVNTVLAARAAEVAALTDRYEQEKIAALNTEYPEDVVQRYIAEAETPADS